MRPARPAASRFLRLLPCRAALLAVSVVLLGCGGGKDSPVITQFESTPSSIEVGEMATLKMAFAHGEGRLEPNVGVVTSGTDLEVSPSSDTQYTLTVSSGEGVTAAKTKVAVKPGLMLKVEGLPTGVDAAVTVEGPDGFTQSITRTTPLKGLKPGAYTVRAAAVKEGEISRPPLRLSQEVVIGNTGAQVTVSYPAPTLSFKLPGDVALDFVLIPPGSFMMGLDPAHITPDWKRLDIAYASPRQEIRFQRAFYLAKYPTTRAQWSALLGPIPPFEGKGPDNPMNETSWLDVRFKFIPALVKLLPGQDFRLPSEAEWEYALRAGSTTRYFWGDDYAQISTYCWTYADTMALGKPYPKVGLKQPNAWGLHDMFSITQWLEDDDHYELIGMPTDGRPWVENPRRYYKGARGLIWSAGYHPEDAVYFASASRGWLQNYPELNNSLYGSRLALSIPE